MWLNHTGLEPRDPQGGPGNRSTVRCATRSFAGHAPTKEPRRQFGGRSFAPPPCIHYFPRDVFFFFVLVALGVSVACFSFFLAAIPNLPILMNVDDQYRVYRTHVSVNTLNSANGDSRVRGR